MNDKSRANFLMIIRTEDRDIQMSGSNKMEKDA